VGVTVSAVVLGALAGALLAWLLLGRRRRAEAARHQRERHDTERSLLRLRQELDELEGRAREHAELFEMLPTLMWQLFGADTRRSLSPVALKMVDQLFDPQRAAVFQARPDGTLSLAVAQGFDPALPTGLEIPRGEGRIGYVAETGQPMDAADFGGLSGITRRYLEGTGRPDLLVDVAAPIRDEADHLIGVLAMSGARKRNGQEKRLLRMAGSLVGLAHTYVARLRVVQHAADMDALTGTYNKRGFQRRLADEMRRAEVEGRPLSLLLLDLDRFKEYNDAHGHLEGDDVLRRLGHLLRRSIREDDVAARYGGDEFVVLYRGVGKARATELAEALRRAMEGEGLAAGPRPADALTLSGGVATLPDDGRSSVDLIRAADHALYEAKAGGRNRIVAAGPAA
jgi:diguanylate cyclase (GGDEF)-like protein